MKFTGLTAHLEADIPFLRSLWQEWKGKDMSQYPELRKMLRIISEVPGVCEE